MRGTWAFKADLIKNSVTTYLFIYKMCFANAENVGWFGWVLWHINLCRLFNAKSIFIQILFQTIQFSMSTQFVKNISFSSYSV